MGRPKAIVNKEECSEDLCFICKDGGHIRVCDYKNCLKAYHPHCVGKDPSFLESEERWTCSWHSCFLCKKSSTFQCFGCPSGICRSCVRNAVFVQCNKRTKGFCNNCLKLAILVEENADVDSDGGKVDFHDTDTYEFLFKDYWQLVKEKEGLTLVDLHAADALLKGGKKCKNESDQEIGSEELMGDSDGMGDEYDIGSSLFDEFNVKKSRNKTPFKKSKSKRKKYIGWGSEELVAFLTSIGKDTETPLAKFQVFEVIKRYVESNNLFHPAKKKKVLCDNRLYLVFRKKQIKLQKMYSMLDIHFAAHGGGLVSSSEEDYDINLVTVKKMRRTTSGSKNDCPDQNHYKERMSLQHKSRYASMVDKNIQSIYLRRSLILELLKNQEIFECSIVGCFVRIKNDPKSFYYLPGKNYQLGLVVAIKTSHPYRIGEMNTDIALKVSGIFSDIQISMLSDEDFEEEECEDLRQLMKKGDLRRPTVEELQKKIRAVHEYIMNHWIDREIKKLQKQIDRANEKGWRRELAEYLDRRVLLQNPEERARLLREIPEVIADIEDEIKTDTSVSKQNTDEVTDRKVTLQNHECSRFLKRMSEAHADTEEERKTVASPPSRNSDEVTDGRVLENPEERTRHLKEIEEVIDTDIEEIKTVTPPRENADIKEITTVASPRENSDIKEITRVASPRENSGVPPREVADAATPRDLADATRRDMTVIEIDDEEEPKKEKSVPIFDVDDDEDDAVESNYEKESKSSSNKCEEKPGVSIEENERIWFYIDPEGKEQGPFPMSHLRGWKQDGYFKEGFKVWRAGQPRQSAILLTYALQITKNCDPLL